METNRDLSNRLTYRYVLDGRAEVQVSTRAEIHELIERGNRIKRRAATAMNQRSSRAHTLVFLTLSTSAPTWGTGKQLPPIRSSCGNVLTFCTDVGNENRRTSHRVSRICLADLGGSEKLSKSKANEGTLGAGKVPWAEYYASRVRLKEATAINGGLFVLKRCMECLNHISAGEIDVR